MLPSHCALQGTDDFFAEALRLPIEALYSLSTARLSASSAVMIVQPYAPSFHDLQDL